MISQIERFSMQIDEIAAKQKAFLEEGFSLIKDKSLPLEERWALFEKMTDATPHIHGWILHFSFEEKDKENLCYYDDLNIQKYETITFVNLLNRLYEGEYVSDERLEEIKEEFLASGYTGFQFDW